ncbi:MAG TPA: glutathione S-transferase family protein [Steroidobacteraceae bacterium]|nr:glutathione S-transferase family protein [Steroidobacteraceae bacterium]
MALKLHVFPPSPRAFKVIALAAYLRLDYETCLVDFAKGTHKTPEFTRLNPNQKMPVLEDDGFVLWEANAILQYLAAKRPESGVLPADPVKRVRVTQWQFWDLAHWEPACALVIFERLVKPSFGLGAEDAAKVAEGMEKLARVAPVLDGQLARSRFVVGEEPTVADFSLGAPLITQPFSRFPLDQYPNILRWYKSLTELPGWSKSIAQPRMPAAA